MRSARLHLESTKPGTRSARLNLEGRTPGRRGARFRLLTVSLALMPMLSGACTPAPETVSIGRRAVVFQSDFGGAVMHGIAHGVSRDLYIDDISHSLPVFDIRAAARSLDGVAAFWPPGTVFVSVIDPGVGTPRRSVVLQTRSGHYFVSPDNGTLALVAESLGIEAVREIDESVNRRPGTGWSHTFHGRDVYSFTGARLAAGVITYEQVGPLLDPEVIALDEPRAEVADGVAAGHVTGRGGRFGNIATDIDLTDFEQLGLEDNGTLVRVTIRHGAVTTYAATLPYVRTFGEVPEGSPLLFANSDHYMSLALNQGSFADTHGIETGDDWTVEIREATDGQLNLGENGDGEHTASAIGSVAARATTPKLGVLIAGV